MRTIMITGVCGAGKTTIVKEVARILHLSCGDYADLMLEVMSENDKDKIQHLGWDEKRKIYDEVEKLIAARFRQSDDESVHILENHLTIVQNAKIISFPSEDYRKYNLLAIVIIETESQIIFNRRIRDRTRNRNPETVPVISEQQKLNTIEAQNISNYLHIPVFRIENQEENLGQAVGKTIEIIQSILDQSSL